MHQPRVRHTRVGLVSGLNKTPTPKVNDPDSWEGPGIGQLHQDVLQFKVPVEDASLVHLLGGSKTKSKGGLNSAQQEHCPLSQAHERRFITRARASTM